jgi:hypothetical protein
MNRTRQKPSYVQPIRTTGPVGTNYLGEAFRIASGQSPRTPKRAHLVAVIAHCRKLVSAMITLPEVR